MTPIDVRRLVEECAALQREFQLAQEAFQRAREQAGLRQANETKEKQVVARLAEQHLTKKDIERRGRDALLDTRAASRAQKEWHAREALFRGALATSIQSITNRKLTSMERAALRVLANSASDDESPSVGWRPRASLPFYGTYRPHGPIDRRLLVTAAAMGDPPPGRSALDRRLASA